MPAPMRLSARCRRSRGERAVTQHNCGVWRATDIYVGTVDAGLIRDATCPRGGTATFTPSTWPSPPQSFGQLMFNTTNATCSLRCRGPRMVEFSHMYPNSVVNVGDSLRPIPPHSRLRS